jgi:hypothetical protein
MKLFILIAAMLLLIPYAAFGAAKEPIVFATYADGAQQLQHALVLTQSIRSFGGRLKEAPIWVFAPQRLLDTQREMFPKFGELKAELKPSEAPQEALIYPFGGKVFGAAAAEAEAKGTASILAWLDEDTVVLGEPKELLLAKGKTLGCRPVTKQNIGSLFDEAPDAFWNRVYDKLSIPTTDLFPMKTVADGRTIRPYVNAGLLAVRPERGILEKWAEVFPILYRDAQIAGMCRNDQAKRLFLHQAALAGAILELLKKDEMVELSSAYNYPLFIKEMYGAEKEFDNLDGVVTLRYDVYFQKPAPDWAQKLKGPADEIAWLKEHLGNDAGAREGTSTKMRFRFQQKEGGRK